MCDTILSVSASKLSDINSKFRSNGTLVIVTHTQKKSILNFLEWAGIPQSV
jgi:hypothetical protein